jgi:hypothetical protein
MDAMPFVLLMLMTAQAPEPAVGNDPATDDKSTYTTTAVQGHIVWLRDEVAQDGIKLVAGDTTGTLVLKDGNGKLHPLLEDRRGRAFRLDPRLRANKVELMVRRFPAHPFLQVLKVYEFDEDGVKHELVYWCEICAITMFELKPCDCCQGKIELQRRKVKQ